jgi:hypothetical protein
MLPVNSGLPFSQRDSMHPADCDLSRIISWLGHYSCKFSSFSDWKDQQAVFLTRSSSSQV